jgi:hypothetical protein
VTSGHGVPDEKKNEFPPETTIVLIGRDEISILIGATMIIIIKRSVTLIYIFAVTTEELLSDVFSVL